MLPPAWVDPAVLRPLEPGDPHDVGGYQVLGLLGTGGMGRVLLARTQSGRPLAIKMVRPEYATDPEFRRRFKQEVAAAQQVQHRRVAAVVDAAPDAPHPWLATAYVPGPSLAQAIGQWGPLPVETVLVLAAGAAAALGAIHEAGIVHRDLKPSNVLLAPDGPVVIDFGIARATESTPLTRTGLRIGSPQFMSPEQALGDPAGPASDVFALGSLIFFAATGRAPFGDGPDTAVLYRIVHEEPRLDGCPEQFQTLVTRCLAKDPVGRPSIEEFIRAVTPEAKSGPLDAAVSGTGTKIWLPPALTKILPMYEARQPATSPGAPPRQAQQPQGAVPLPHLRHHGAQSRRGVLIGAAVGALLVVSLIGVVASRGTHASSAAPLVAPLTAASTSLTPVPDISPPAEVTPSDSPTESPTPAASSSPSPRAGAVLGTYKGINLSSGYGINILEHPKHPTNSGQKDVTFNGGGIQSDTGNDGTTAARFAVLSSRQRSDYATCRDDTRYTDSLSITLAPADGMPAGDIKVGSRVCVTSASGAIGLLKITDAQSSPVAFIAFDIKVWRGENQPTPTDSPTAG